MAGLQLVLKYFDLTWTSPARQVPIFKSYLLLSVSDACVALTGTLHLGVPIFYSTNICTDISSYAFSHQHSFLFSFFFP